MNAGAYGSDWKAILVRALVVDATAAAVGDERGARARVPPLRSSSRARSSRGSSSSSSPRPAAEIREIVADAAGPPEGDAADEQAHVRQRVQEPGPRARRRPDDRGLRPEGAPHRRGAHLAAPCELHRERWRRDRRRRDRPDGRGPRARARPLRGRTRARGRAARRPRAAPAGRPRADAQSRLGAGPRRVRGEAKLAMAARPRAPPPPSPSGRRRPARRRVALVLVGSAHRRVLRCPRDGDLRPRPDPGHRCAAVRRCQDQCDGPPQPYVGASLVRFDRGRAARRLAAVSEVADARFDRDFPHTLKVRVRLERPVAVLRQGPDAWLVSASARVLERLRQAPVSAPAADLAAGSAPTSRSTRRWAASGRVAWPPSRRSRPLALPRRVRQVVAGRRAADAGARARAPSCASATAATCG